MGESGNFIKIDKDTFLRGDRDYRDSALFVGISDVNKKIDQILISTKDHENRLVCIEGKQSKVIGISAVIGLVIGFISAVIAFTK